MFYNILSWFSYWHYVKLLHYIVNNKASLKDLSFKNYKNGDYKRTNQQFS